MESKPETRPDEAWEVSGGEHDEELIPGLLAAIRAYDETRVMQDAQYLDENPETAEEADRRVDEMRKYLFSGLGLSPHDDLVKKHRDTMRFSMLEAICDQVLLSGRALWADKSPYYCALILEYQVRMQWVSILGTNRGSML